LLFLFVLFSFIEQRLAAVHVWEWCAQRHERNALFSLAQVVQKGLIDKMEPNAILAASLYKASSDLGHPFSTVVSFSVFLSLFYGLV
jgi:hypothetical protein